MTIEFVKEKFGRLDNLANNTDGGVTIKEVSEFSVEENCFSSPQAQLIIEFSLNINQ